VSRIDNEVRITPSVLDRLLDDRPEEKLEAPASRQTNLRILKQAVKRDLEWLLNTRANVTDIAEGLPELNRSLATFGLPDFSSWNVRGGGDQETLRRTIEDAVARFEPRLEAVQVTLETMSEVDRTVRFRIEARLRVEPAPEPVTFDSVLQLGTREFVLQGS
jgi:type VI secretion system protein ImpF